jgi:hypothetical protein
VVSMGREMCGGEFWARGLGRSGAGVCCLGCLGFCLLEEWIAGLLGGKGKTMELVGGVFRYGFVDIVGVGVICFSR